jgi:hypothetical protein
LDFWVVTELPSMYKFVNQSYSAEVVKVLEKIQKGLGQHIRNRFGSKYPPPN